LHHIFCKTTIGSNRFCYVGFKYSNSQAFFASVRCFPKLFAAIPARSIPIAPRLNEEEYPLSDVVPTLVLANSDAFCGKHSGARKASNPEASGLQS
jgi:hypothetical protein